MTMPEILRRKLMERIDIASEPDDGEVLEEIDRLILGEEETRYLPVAQKAELRRQLFTVCGGSMSCRSCWKMRELPKLW